MKTRKFIVFIKGDGQRHFITKQSIKTRKFIGNTTMDAQLALLMANLGKIFFLSWKEFWYCGILTF